MTRPEDLAAVLNDTMDLLHNSRNHTIIDLCHLGLSPRTAKLISTLTHLHYGPTTATRRQTDCVEAARTNNHTLETLDEIEKQVRKLNNKDNAWRLRLELCREPANIRTLRTRAKHLIDDYNGPEEINNQLKISASAIPGSTYTRLRIDAPGHLIQAALDTLHTTNGTDPAHTALTALAALSGSASGENPPITPAVIIALDTATRLAVGDGDEVILSLTNGTRMTGEDFIHTTLADAGLVMLVHPVAGPVNLYHSSRFPNPKQRMMAKLENPVCAAAGCGVGADYAQVHHITAWKHGGHTNINGLCTCCAFHNGRNDDNRDQPRYGYLDRIDGQVHHVPAFGGPPVLNDHPVARGGAMRVA